LYELNGKVLTTEQTLEVYHKTCERFLADHQGNYFGTKFIYGPSRNKAVDVLWEHVLLAKKLRKIFPDFLIGFDLVGHELEGKSLVEFLDPLLALSEGDEPMAVFYHAGETNWQGMSTDENLIDALLLNASRIGHGYALAKHPEAKRLALERDIPIEVCPISNQVLNLISDLRNHPAAILISEGFPIVVSGDGRGSWEADPLSHDFYQAFMVLGGGKADLRFLKQLALNSIKYSTLDEYGKSQLMRLWEKRWQDFIL
ncbi:cat eye syndrome chromosome region, candidate 1, partial [Halocaridina rubra]